MEAGLWSRSRLVPLPNSADWDAGSPIVVVELGKVRIGAGLFVVASECVAIALKSPLGLWYFARVSDARGALSVWRLSERDERL